MAINRPGNTPNPGNINPLGGPDKAADAKKAGGAAFNPNVNAPQTTPTPGSTPASGGGQPNLDAVKARIQQGLDQGQTKAQILETLVGDHLDQAFKGQATEAVKQQVTHRFQSDPELNRLFNALYGVATKKS